jgi:hypothetical protein
VGSFSSDVVDGDGVHDVFQDDDGNGNDNDGNASNDDDGSGVVSMTSRRVVSALVLSEFVVAAGLALVVCRPNLVGGVVWRRVRVAFVNRASLWLRSVCEDDDDDDDYYYYYHCCCCCCCCCCFFIKGRLSMVNETHCLLFHLC